MQRLLVVGKPALRAKTSSCLLKQTHSTVILLSFRRWITTAGNVSENKQRRFASLSGGVNQAAVAANQMSRLSPTISVATPQNDNSMLEVKWDDGVSDSYPYIWMRDNCQCSECFHQSSKGRMILLDELKLSVSPTSVTVNKAGNEVMVDWSDGHKGLYPSDWLQQRSFREEKRNQRQQSTRFQRTYWNSEIAKKLPECSFSEILKDDDALLKFLQQVEELGLVIIHEAPTRRGEIETLSDRVGYLRRTHYGRTFSVKEKIDANNLAYTSGSLNMHVDLPFLDYKPGVQLLHCISQTDGEGGENDFVDSFHVAQKLRNLHPDKFDILTTTPVDFIDEGVEEDGSQFHAISQKPMIEVDKHGLISTVNLNQMVRDSYFDVPVENVISWYDAMLTYHELLYHPDNLLTYKLRDGDIAVFDNNRVLHGRKGYHITKGKRELEGCYWDWDMIKSCQRMLKHKLGNK